MKLNPAIILSLLFALGLVCPTPSFASLCTKFFTSAYAGALALKPEHDFEPLRGRDLRRSVLLSDVPASYQGPAGVCYLHCPTARSERGTRDVFGIDGVPLSREFNLLQEFKASIRPMLINDYVFKDNGNSPLTVDWLIRERGLMPASAWKPKLNPHLAPNFTALHHGLNERLAAFRKSIRELKANGGDSAAASELFNRAEREMHDYLDQMFGVPPEEFEVDGVKYTAKTFGEKIAGLERTLFDYVTPIETPPEYTGPDPVPIPQTQENTELKDGFPELREQFGPARAENLFPFERAFMARNILAEKLPVDRIIQEIVLSLERGTPVYIGLNIVPQYFDEAAGVFSIEFRGGYREGPQARIGGHALLLTGVYRELDGRVLGFRVQNSWGERRGRRGYDFIGVDYFRRFNDEVIFPLLDPRMQLRIPKLDFLNQVGSDG